MEFEALWVELTVDCIGLDAASVDMDYDTILLDQSAEVDYL